MTSSYHWRDMAAAAANFAEQYRTLSDDDLLLLAQDRRDLLPEASLALDQELHARGIAAANIAQFSAELQRHQEQVEVASATPKWFLPHQGIGKRFYGSSNRKVSSTHGIEEYDATLWAVFFWLPLIPLGTYRVRRAAMPVWQRWIAGGRMHVLARQQQRDWGQILLTWVETLFILLIVGSASRFWLRWG